MDYESNTQVRFKLFESVIKSWTSLCQEAADFATSLPKDSLISVSHAQEGMRGSVIVWFRT
jgi:hypothetical protein